MTAPAGSAPKNMPMPDFSTIKLPGAQKRYRVPGNRGYKLTIDNLPWGTNASFTLKRYRLTGDHNFDVVEERQASGDHLEISNPLPPPGLELIELSKM